MTDTITRKIPFHLLLAWTWPMVIMAMTLTACSEEAGFNGDAGTKEISSPGTADGSTPSTEPFPSGTDPLPGAEDIPQNCTDQHRALRIAFVVDNSGSMSCKPGSVKTSSQDVCGTDPIKENSPRGGIGFTDRQNAIFAAITRTIAKDNATRKINSEFVGSSFGISSFPRDGKSMDGLNNSVYHSGIGSVLPDTLTNTSAMGETEAFQDSLWNLMSFTHMPEGPTPYATALRGARKLLENRDPQDKRSDVVMLITDGLPTDDKPSDVVRAREELGKDVKLIILSLYQPGKSRDEQNAPAKDTLQKAWNEPSIMWGHKSGNNDGFADFQAYWQALIDLPEKVADEVVEINGSDNLEATMDSVLGSVQTCQ